jgi:hypothetical protein
LPCLRTTGTALTALEIIMFLSRKITSVWLPQNFL